MQIKNLALIIILSTGHFNIYAHDLKPLKLIQTIQMNHKILKQRAKEIKFPINEKTKSIINQMKNFIRTMEDNDGSTTVGLAAPQVGYPLRLFFYQIPSKLAVHEGIEYVPLSFLINPSYVPSKNSTSKKSWEGCLSIPDMMGEALRYDNIEYSGYNINGEKITGTASGVLAQIIQHETDHLDGILYTSKIPSDGKYISTLEAMAMEKQN